MNGFEIVLLPSTLTILPPPRKRPFRMTYFIRPKRQTFEKEIGVIANSTAKPRVDTLSVKSEPVDIVDIKSEPLDVVAIKTELLD